MINDIINGIIEIIGGGVCLLNIRRILKDKQVKGVSWLVTVFFTTWGAWNLYYYPSLNQPLSFIGAFFTFLSNAIWLGLVLYYGRKTKIKF